MKNRSKLEISVLAFFLATSPLFSQKEFQHGIGTENQTKSNQFLATRLQSVGQWSWGTCVTVQARGNYAFIGNGQLFQTIDISNPAQPTIVGQVLTGGHVNNIALSGNYAFVISPFQVIDISVPFLPRIVYLEQNIAIKIVVHGNYAYLGDFSGLVHILDISRPTVPHEVGSILTGGEGVTGMAIVDDTLLYTTTLDGLAIDIINVADKANPIYLTYYSIASTTGGLAIQDSCLFFSTPASIGVLDIANRTNPLYLGQLSFTTSAGIPAFSVDNSFAYISTRDSFAVADMSDRRNPRIISSISWLYPDTVSELPSSGPGLPSVDSGLVCMPTQNGFWFVDVHDPMSLKSVSFFPTGATSVDVFAKDSLLYIAAGTGGMQILSIQDPSAPKLISSLITSDFAFRILVNGSTALVLSDNSLHAQTVHIIDVTNSNGPTELSKFDLYDTTAGAVSLNLGSIAANGSLWAVGSRFKRLSIFDLTDPSHPIVLATTSTSDVPVGMAWTGSTLSIAEYNSGMAIYDVSQPSQPNQIGRFNLLPVEGIAAWNGKLLAACGAGLSVFDISNPANPIQVNYVSTIDGRSTVALASSGNSAYMAYNNYFVNVNLSNGSQPAELDSIFVNGAWGVAAKGDLVFISCLGQGVQVFRNTQLDLVDVQNIPTNFTLFQNYPNPFNPTTIIRYELPKREYVSLKVLDLLGREVATVLNGMESAGQNEVSFNAMSLPSGIYFYQMKRDGKIVTKKMLLIR